MMTFKEFYLRSSQGAKAPLLTSRNSKTPKRQNEILDRIAKLKAAKFRSRRISETNADIAEPARLTHNRRHACRNAGHRPARISSSRRRCCPALSKLAGPSHSS